MTLNFEPLISPALWAALALLALAMLAWYALRRPASVTPRRWALIAALMAAGAALPLAILLNPTWRLTVPPPAGKPLLTILVDVSASMSADDLPQGQTRYAAAAAVAQACAKQMAGQFEIRTAEFSSHVTNVEASSLAARSANGEATDLAAAVAEAVASDRPGGQAILLLSDGIHNAGGGTANVLSALSVARAAAAPIYTKTLGGSAEINDLSLRLRSPQQLSFVGQSVPASVAVRRLGRAPRKVTLVLEHKGQELARQEAVASADGLAETRFLVRQDEPGVYRYDLRVEPFEGEVTRVNNYATLLLRVVDEPIRVLLLEGKPYWDAKFLVRTLLSDPSIELVSVVRLAEGRLIERTIKRRRADQNENTAAGGDKTAGDKSTGDAATQPAAAPLEEAWRIVADPAAVLGDAAALRSYQAIVLGRDAEVFLTDDALENVRHWLSRESGSLVCYRGQPTTRVNQRLGRLLPIEWDQAPETHARVQLTESGRELRWLDALGGEMPGDALPQLQSLAIGRAEKPKPLATVLAAAVGNSSQGELPVISFQPYGGGRVVVVEGAGMWRWAFLPPTYAEHHEVYAALWQSLLRWLISGAGLLPGQKLAMRTDKVIFRADEPATATLLARDEADLQGVQVALTGDDGQARNFAPAPAGDEPGVFRVAFGQLPEGRYEARLAGVADSHPAVQTAFDVRRFSEEQLDLNARGDLLARIAQNTGGAVLEGDQPGEIAERFAARLAGSRPEQVRRLPAWDRWWVLVGVFGVWFTTWSLRRRGGLV